MDKGIKPCTGSRTKNLSYLERYIHLRKDSGSYRIIHIMMYVRDLIGDSDNSSL